MQKQHLPIEFPSDGKLGGAMHNSRYSWMGLSPAPALLFAVLILVIAGPVSPVRAQEETNAGSADSDEQLEEVIVTGSRIARDEYTLTQGLLTFGEEEIRDRGFDNVAQALNDNPSFGIPGSDNVGRAGGAKFDGGEPIGPFPTWGALYATVLVWAAILVALLYVFTRVFDRGVP